MKASKLYPNTILPFYIINTLVDSQLHSLSGQEIQKMKSTKLYPKITVHLYDINVNKSLRGQSVGHWRTPRQVYPARVDERAQLLHLEIYHCQLQLAPLKKKHRSLYELLAQRSSPKTTQTSGSGSKTTPYRFKGPDWRRISPATILSGAGGVMD